jgi:hypothetical protein
MGERGTRQKAPRHNLHLTALASAENVAQDLSRSTRSRYRHRAPACRITLPGISSRWLFPRDRTTSSDTHISWLAERMLHPTRRLRPRAYVPRRYDAFQDPRMKQHPVLLTRHETSRTTLDTGTGVACQHSIHEHVDMQSDLDVAVSPLRDVEPSHGSYGRRACSGRVS